MGGHLVRRSIFGDPFLSQLKSECRVPLPSSSSVSFSLTSFGRPPSFMTLAKISVLTREV